MTIRQTWVEGWEGFESMLSKHEGCVELLLHIYSYNDWFDMLLAFDQLEMVLVKRFPKSGSSGKQELYFNVGID